MSCLLPAGLCEYTCRARRFQGGRALPWRRPWYMMLAEEPVATGPNAPEPSESIRRWKRSDRFVSIAAGAAVALFIAGWILLKVVLPARDLGRHEVDVERPGGFTQRPVDS